MTCEVHVVEDSKDVLSGERITTLQLRYWRAIHAEFMTHRVFSRNASSSRAIPVAKMLEQVRTDPAGPIRFEKNKPGMQSTEPLEDQQRARDLWRLAATEAAMSAEMMMAMGVHKQFANRLLEPFQYISVVVTSTNWQNFFDLRCHPDAMPEIRELAEAMRDAINCSQPKPLHIGEWHLPYVRGQERLSLPLRTQIQCSVARCARVSYLTHDREDPKPDEDVKLHDRLVASIPRHSSPAEHQVTPEVVGFRHTPRLHGNFGPQWVQYRQLLDYGFVDGMWARETYFGERTHA